MVNRVRPISDFENSAVNMEPVLNAPKVLDGTLYLKISSEADPQLRKIKAILNMFPGDRTVVLYFADTKVRRGTRCMLAESMIRELKKILGESNVVVK